MPQLKTIAELENLVLTRRLIRPDLWTGVRDEVHACAGPEEALQTLERRQLLTSYQTGRIRKGETDSLVLGRYKLLYRNASGSFARVFRGTTLDDSTSVAIKLLRDRWAADPDAVAGFLREARICKRFVHPNIVPIIDIGSQGNYHFFTMEFVEGGNLRDFMKIRKRLEPTEATRCMYQICSGLDYALRMGATHRDLKLTNVLMSSEGVAKLVDFGLAGQEDPARVGTSDDVHRALEYAALERGTNAPNNDPRSDMFFAGGIYYELLSGESPWERTRDRESRKQLSRYTNVRPLDVVRPDLPKTCRAIVSRLMQFSPHDRYQTYPELLADLRTCLKELGEPVTDESSGSNADLQDDAGPFRLLIIDPFRKRHKVLQEYFTRHGFETAFAERPEVSVNRLRSNSPPDGVLLLADRDSEEVLTLFPRIQAFARSLKVPCLAVFAGNEEESVRKQVVSTRYGATMFQPATLRRIREHFDEVNSITR